MGPDTANEPTPTDNTEQPQASQPAGSPPDTDTSVPVTVKPAAPPTTTPEATSQPSSAPTPTPVAETAPLTPTQPTFQADTPPPASENSVPESAAPPSQPGQSVIMGSTPGVPHMLDAPAPSGTPKKRRKLPLIIAVVVLVLLLAGGYVFAFYLPNTPANMYKTALSRSNIAYDRLVNYATTTQAAHYKGFTANGSFKLTSASGSGDGTFSAASDGSNSQGNVNVDIFGEKLNANYRSIVAKGQTTPDVYLQVKGIKTMLDSFGLKQFDNLDGQWISIDHTIIETGLANVQGSDTKKTPPPTYADVKDAMVKFGDVNEKYIFTTDSQYAVLKNEQYVGKSTQDGRTVAGYKVGYDKAHLKIYLDAVGTALDSSGLGKWYQQTNNKTLSSTLQLDEAKKSVDKAKSDYTFNMYVDAKTKLIHKVHFADTKDPANNYFELGLNYVGGSRYPFVFDVHGKEDGSTDVAHMAMTLDSSTNQIDVQMNGSSKSDTTTNFTLKMTAKPTNDTLNVTAPKGAKSVMSVLNSLGLGGLLKSSPTGSFAASNNQNQAYDAERKSDISSTDTLIMAYWANKGVYPSLSQINNPSWRSANMKSLQAESLKDPQGASSQLASKPAKHVYAYQTAGCSSKGCDSFKLSATLSTGKLFSQSGS
jgi:hypothetical protein